MVKLRYEDKISIPLVPYFLFIKLISHVVFILQLMLNLFKRTKGRDPILISCLSSNSSQFLSHKNKNNRFKDRLGRIKNKASKLLGKMIYDLLNFPRQSKTIYLGAAWYLCDIRSERFLKSLLGARGITPKLMTLPCKHLRRFKLLHHMWSTEHCQV